MPPSSGLYLLISPSLLLEYATSIASRGTTHKLNIYGQDHIIWKEVEDARMIILGHIVYIVLIVNT